MSARRSTTGLGRWTLAAALLAAIASAGVVVRFARSLVTPPHKQQYPLRIEGIDRVHQQIVLNDTAAARLPGHYGLWFGNDAGYIRMGDVLEVRPGRVVRALDEVVSGTPRRGHAARDSGWYFLGPWDLGLDYRALQLPTPLGPSEAWLVEPADGHDSTDWVIHVHGRTALRAETLRGVKVASAHGWRSLVVSYRNDPMAPRSRDGRYGLGLTEADDVVAAVRWAIEQGAKRVVLFGWSMGGTIALQAAARLQHTPEGDQLCGLILDSPALSWPNIIRHHARLLHLPTAAGGAVIALLSSRLAPTLTGLSTPIDFHRLDAEPIVAALGLPVLLMHSADEDYVPVAPARALAAAHPDLVEYVEFSDAGHVRLWNRDPERWEHTVASWLDRQRAQR